MKHENPYLQGAFAWNLNWHCVLSEKFAQWGNLYPSCLIYNFWRAWKLFCIKKSQRYLHWHNICIFHFLWFRSGATTRSLVLHFLRFRSGASTRSLVSSYNSVREYQPEVSYLPTIPFGSINPESLIFLRFYSGASTRSLVSSYNSVRECQPGVSYLLRFRSGASTRSLVFSYDSVREYQPEVSYFSYDSIREMCQSLELKF